MKKHVFLSYCRDNAEEVGHLHADLRQAGEMVWWDQDIVPGQYWKDEIRQAMQESYAVVLCLSQEVTARTTSGIFPEMRDAIEQYRLYPPGSIFLIPVRLSACTVPSLAIDATRTLQDLEYVDLFPAAQRATGLQRLLQALRRAPGRPPAQDPLLMAGEKQQRREETDAARRQAEEERQQREAAEAVQRRTEEERQQREETKRQLKIFGTNESNVNAELLYGTALVDATSVAFICQDQCIRMATDSAVKLLRNKDTAALLRMLEWSVVYNLQAHDLALDSLGVDPARLTKTYGNLINPTEISRETLIGASQRVEQIRDLVNKQRQELSTSPLCPWGDEPVKHAPYAITQAWPRPLETLGRIEVRGERGIYEFGSAEKIYFDRCVTNDLPRVQAIARSNDDAERALFYAELSDMLSTPVLLSDGQQRWLQEVHSRLLTELHTLISKVIDDEAKRVIVSRLTDAHISPSIIDTQHPPLAERIVRLARSRQCSLVDAAQEIRVSPEAVAYRSLLVQLYSYAKLGRAGQDKLTALIGEIEREFYKWYRKEDKTVTPVKLQLAKIPSIGWLFELIGLAEIPIQLPKHQRENPYLSFIFDWYRPQQSSE